MDGMGVRRTLRWVRSVAIGVAVGSGLGVVAYFLGAEWVALLYGAIVASVLTAALR